MKQRFGALLCLALGAVLITTGLSEHGAAVGTVAPSCGGQGPGITFPCPTGTISVTETTAPGSASAHAPAAGWIVHITSACLDTSSGDPVDLTLTIADGDTATTDPLFLFADVQHLTPCSYALAADAVANFTGAFDPASPVVIPFTLNQQSGNSADVALTETYVAPSTSSAPSTSPTSIVTTDSALPSASVSPITAATGPREQVRVTVYIGIALCLLGLVLLVGGRAQRRLGRHSRH